MLLEHYGPRGRRHVATITPKKFALMGAMLVIALGCRTIGFVRDVITGDRSRRRRCGNLRRSTRSGSSSTS